MVGTSTMALLRVAILSGLCATAHANTTAVLAAQQATPAAGAPSTTGRLYDVTPPTSLSDTVSAPNLARVRVAVLLPLDSATLARAAGAVRSGFEAAYRHDRQDLVIDVIATGDTSAAVLTAYADAEPTHDIVVGPLTRSGVTAIAQRGAISKPTVALSQPDSTSDSETLLPPNMLSIGLSIEDEARQSASALADDATLRNAFVVAGSAAWQKRAARAFTAEWQRQGRSAQSMELGINAGNVSASGLLQLRKRLQAESPAFLFVALDAEQTRQVRSAIGHEAVIHGTSQLNPYWLDNREPSETAIELNGVRLLDIPWQLQADHPAVMIYPHPLVAVDQKRSADLERLYALGIDAYRVVLEIAIGRSDFEIDGVTGRLSISVGKGPSHFERVTQPAVYQNGLVVPVLGTR